MSPVSMSSFLFFVAGTCLWVVGFIFESRGDWLLFRSQQKYRVGSGKQDGICLITNDLFSYCQNPHLFGTMLVWWGYFMMNLSTFSLEENKTFIVILISALSTSLQSYMLISSATRQEIASSTVDQASRDYLERTPLFWPLLSN
jgi:steroid 5-alpha reductase family enzyme